MCTRGTSLTDTSVRVEAGTDGTLLSYDKLSRRASAEYSFNGQAIKEIYGYSSDGFLQTTSQNGALVATRALDALGRTVKAKDLVNLLKTQTDYDADHRLDLGSDHARTGTWRRLRS